MYWLIDKGGEWVCERTTEKTASEDPGKKSLEVLHIGVYRHIVSILLFIKNDNYKLEGV